MNNNFAYAFQNIRNKKFIQGTDFRCCPHRQILTDTTPMLFNEYQRDIGFIGTEMKRRGINPESYRVVRVKFEVVEEDE